MSSSLLYHASAPRLPYTRTLSGDGIFTIHQDLVLRCSPAARHGSSPRPVVRLRSLPIGAARPRGLAHPTRCVACGPLRQVEVCFADPRRSYAAALTLRPGLGDASIRDVAVSGVGWPDQDIRAPLASLRRPLPRYIAIADRHRRHRYLTIVMDLETGAVVFVGDGKGADALKPFWKRLRPAEPRSQAVAMDMSAAYRRPSRRTCRRRRSSSTASMSSSCSTTSSPSPPALHREAIDVLHKQVLKGTRWLLLKNPENLDAAKDEKRRLEEALSLNKPLATAYYMKEDLHQFWEQPGKRFATPFLASWIRRAGASGIKTAQQMAATLAAYRSGLLAYYDVMITSGPMEGRTTRSRR